VQVIGLLEHDQTARDLPEKAAQIARRANRQQREELANLSKLKPYLVMLNRAFFCTHLTPKSSSSFEKGALSSKISHNHRP
jgi:hypothetical protein